MLAKTTLHIHSLIAVKLVAGVGFHLAVILQGKLLLLQGCHQPAGL